MPSDTIDAPTYTMDREGGRFFTTEQLGSRQELTPEGYLVCYDVPIARAGSMVYAYFELPQLKPGPDNSITVLRSPEELFDPDTIASIEGKAITIDHPPRKIDPSSWKRLTLGTALNVRPGTGDQDQLLLADLLISDQDAINLVRNKLITEISLGYDAKYEQDDDNPGFARQHMIRGNHVALVKRGRCGPICSIGDHAMPKISMKDRLKAAFYSRDAGELEDALKGIPDDDASNKEGASRDAAPPGADPADETNNGKDGKGTKDADNAASAIERRVSSLETKVDQILEKLTKTSDAEGDGGNRTEEEEERERVRRAATQDRGRRTKDAEGKPTEKEVEGGEKSNVEEGHRKEAGEGDRSTKDAATTTKDSRYEYERFRTTVAEAEIIAPGMTPPTFDAAMSLTNTNDALCKFKREALRTSYTKDGAGVMSKLLRGQPITTLDSMPCAAVDLLFAATVDGVTRQRENSYHAPRTVTPAQAAQASPASINKRNKEFWQTRA